MQTLNLFVIPLQVTISLKSTGTDIVMLQKDFKIKPKNGAEKKYKPGEYPPFCDPPLDNIEIMSVGLFLIVRVKDPSDPKLIKYEVYSLCMCCFMCFCGDQ